MERSSVGGGGGLSYFDLDRLYTECVERYISNNPLANMCLVIEISEESQTPSARSSARQPMPSAGTLSLSKFSGTTSLT